MDNQNDILEGTKTAFINETYNPANDFKPKFLSNNFNHKVLNSIKEELGFVILLVGILFFSSIHFFCCIFG